MQAASIKPCDQHLRPFLPIRQGMRRAVENSVGMRGVSGVKADLQDLVVHLIQEPIQLWLKVNESCGIGVDGVS
jgi:hypothetical protein